MRYATLYLAAVLIWLSASGAAMAYDIDRFFAELEKHEGLKTHVYDDATGKRLKPGEQPKGHPTIGIGRNLRAKPLTEGELNLLRENRPDLEIRDLYTDGLTEDEAWALANNDRMETEAALDKRIPWWRTLSDARQRALMNMALNMGVDGLLEFRKMLGAMKSGDFERAAREALNSDWAKQVQPTRVQDIERMIREDKAPTIPDAGAQYISGLAEPIQVASLDPNAGMASLLASEPEMLPIAPDPTEQEPVDAAGLAAEIGMAPASPGAPVTPEPVQPAVALPARGRPVVPGGASVGGRESPDPFGDLTAGPQ